MHRKTWFHIGAAILLAIAAIVAIRLHGASGATTAGDIASGRALARGWCQECHRIDATPAASPGAGPDFVAVAEMPSTTELTLKVFLRSSHRNMPNLILTPDQTDDIVSYILSLRRR